MTIERTGAVLAEGLAEAAGVAAALPFLAAGGGQATTACVGRATTSLPRKKDDTTLYARDISDDDSGWNSKARP